MNQLNLPEPEETGIRAVDVEVTFSKAKAYVGAGIATAVAFLGGVATGLTDDGVLTPLEWVLSASAGLVALGAVFGGVFGTPNTPTFTVLD